jgi:hypothetical protein
MPRLNTKISCEISQNVYSKKIKRRYCKVAVEVEIGKTTELTDKHRISENLFKGVTSQEGGENRKNYMEDGNNFNKTIIIRY